MNELTGILSASGELTGRVTTNGHARGDLSAAAYRGYSAYDVAVLNGFEGTEEEWLRSLRGDAPIMSKTYTGVTVSANSDPEGYLYYGFVKPTSYTGVWRIKVRIHAEIPALAEGTADYTLTIDGSKSAASAYWIHNAICNTSYRPLYYLVAYFATQTGIEADYGHLMGIRLQSSYNPTSSTYARTIKIDVLEAEGCTFEFADSMFLYADAPGTGSTNYATRATYDGTVSGDTHTNDKDSRILFRQNYQIRTGSIGVWNGSIFMRDADGTFQNVCTASNGTATASNRTTATTKKANPHGFEVGGAVFYSTGNVDPSATASASYAYESYGAFDSRYSFNTSLVAGSLTPHKPVYLVGTIHSDNLFYLDTVWWTQTPNDTSKVYVEIGNCYDSTTSNCRITLDAVNGWYRYYGGKLLDMNYANYLELRG